MENGVLGHGQLAWTFLCKELPRLIARAMGPQASGKGRQQGAADVIFLFDFVCLLGRRRSPTAHELLSSNEMDEQSV